VVVTFAGYRLDLGSGELWNGSDRVFVPDQPLRILRILIALALMQIGIAALHAGIEAAPSLGVLVVIGAVVPVLTYAFLASIWFMKVCADQMR